MRGIFFILKIFLTITYFLVFLVLSILYLWSIPAIYFIDFQWHWLKIFLSFSFSIFIPIAFIFIRKKILVLLIFLGIWLILAAKYYTMQETNDKNWIISDAVLPSVSFNGNIVKIKNIRNFDYKTKNDFIVRYYDKTFDINTLNTIDYILSYWDGNKNIAHSLLSFGFDNDSYICVSVETRLEKGQPQTGLGGLYNQYGLIYILGDESDILRLRTNFRKEDVYLYPLKAKKTAVRELFLAIMHRVEELRNYPQFYNTVKHNCLTSLLLDLETAIKQKLKFDYRYIFNGLSDEMMYKKGMLQQANELSFMELKKKHNINQYVEDDNSPIDYSKRIRRINNKLK